MDATPLREAKVDRPLVPEESQRRVVDSAKDVVMGEYGDFHITKDGVKTLYCHNDVITVHVPKAPNDPEGTRRTLQDRGLDIATLTQEYVPKTHAYMSPEGKKYVYYFYIRQYADNASRRRVSACCECAYVGRDGFAVTQHALTRHIFEVHEGRSVAEEPSKITKLYFRMAGTLRHEKGSKTQEADWARLGISEFMKPAIDPANVPSTIGPSSGQGRRARSSSGRKCVKKTRRARTTSATTTSATAKKRSPYGLQHDLQQPHHPARAYPMTSGGGGGHAQPRTAKSMSSVAWFPSGSSSVKGSFSTTTSNGSTPGVYTPPSSGMTTPQHLVGEADPMNPPSSAPAIGGTTMLSPATTFRRLTLAPVSGPRIPLGVMTLPSQASMASGGGSVTQGTLPRVEAQPRVARGSYSGPSLPGCGDFEGLQPFKLGGGRAGHTLRSQVVHGLTMDVLSDSDDGDFDIENGHGPKSPLAPFTASPPQSAFLRSPVLLPRSPVMATKRLTLHNTLRENIPRSGEESVTDDSDSEEEIRLEEHRARTAERMSGRVRMGGSCVPNVSHSHSRYSSSSVAPGIHSIRSSASTQGIPSLAPPPLGGVAASGGMGMGGLGLSSAAPPMGDQAFLGFGTESPQQAYLGFSASHGHGLSLDEEGLMVMEDDVVVAPTSPRLGASPFL